MEPNELAFFGKVAAGLTHELKNVLAIINESNGLMADLLTLAKDSPFPHRERLLRSIGKIEDQIKRGVDLTGRFNRFAHSMDSESAPVELGEFTRQTVALLGRFARLRNVELRDDTPDRRITVTTSPFHLQMALGKAIEALTGGMDGGGAISLKVREEAAEPALEITWEGGPEEASDFREGVALSPPWREFEQIASRLRLVFQWREGPGGGIAISFRK